MPKKARAIPDGYHTVTPYLVVPDAGKAIEFYKKAFGAEELVRMPGPNGKGVMHAELKVGNSMVMLGDEMPGGGCVSPKTLKGTTMGLHIYVENVDAAWKRAVDAGAQIAMPLMDMFWGDRYGKLTDPFGHSWSLAQHKEDVSPEEMGKRAAKFMAEAAAPKKK